MQEQVARLCTCAFLPQHISLGELQCFGDSPEVTYRAKINGTASWTSLAVLAIVEEWISSGTASILVQGFRFELDASCLPIAIDSFVDPQCRGTPSPSTDTAAETDNTLIFVGGAFAVVLFTAIAVIFVTVCLLVKRRRQRHVFSAKEGERYAELYIRI